jgi:signal transduction histidine kinase
MKTPGPERTPLRVLLIEDAPPDAALARHALRGDRFEVAWHRSLPEAVPALVARTADVVLLDLSLGETQGLVTLDAVRELSDLPVVVLSGQDDEALALRAVQAGAQDYLVKGPSVAAVLPRALRYAIERKRARDEIEQLNADLEGRVQARTAELARANRELEALFHSITHDLRGPLRSIHGFAELLYEEYGDQLDAGGRDYLQHLQSASRRLEARFDGLLMLDAVGRAELHRAPVDLTALVHEVAQTLPGGEAIHVEPGLAADADPALLRLALEQLLSNALAFAAPVAAPRVDVDVEPGEPDVIRVHDNGVGFEPAYAGQVFEPFRRLHVGEGLSGAGVGLAVAARVVQRHGGHVWAESRPGQGATFSFTLRG